MTKTTVSIEALHAENDAWLRALAQRLCGRPDLADDAVQSTWTRALERTPTRLEQPRGWLARVLKNDVRMRARGETRRRRREGRWAVEDVDRADVPQADARVELDELLCAMGAELGAMEEPYRGTLTAHYLQGREIKQIARDVGIAAGTVRWRLKVGRDRLAAGIERRLGPLGLAFALTFGHGRTAKAATLGTASGSRGVCGPWRRRAVVVAATGVTSVLASVAMSAASASPPPPDLEFVIAKAAEERDDTRHPRTDLAQPRARTTHAATPVAPPRSGPSIAAFAGAGASQPFPEFMDLILPLRVALSGRRRAEPGMELGTKIDSDDPEAPDWCHDAAGFTEGWKEIRLAELEAAWAEGFATCGERARERGVAPADIYLGAMWVVDPELEAGGYESWDVIAPTSLYDAQTHACLAEVYTATPLIPTALDTWSAMDLFTVAWHLELDADGSVRVVTTQPVATAVPQG